MRNQWRKIYTSLFENDDLGLMPLQIRFFYIGLIVFSDDFGRLKGNPKWLRAMIFPYDDVSDAQIYGYVANLERKNKLKTYQVEDEVYVQLIKWTKYNKPRKDRIRAKNCPSPLATSGQPAVNQVATSGQQVVCLDKIRVDKNREDKNIISKPPSADLPKNNNLNFFIEFFKPVNPNYTDIYKNKTQRKALEELVEKHGVEKITRTLKILPATINQKFAPVITTPLQLKNKLGSLIAFVQRQQQAKVKVAAPFQKE